MKHSIDCKIIENTALKPDIFLMTFICPDVAKQALPGQFVHLKCCDNNESMLRRPISICSADGGAGTLTIVYQVKGIGTEYLCRKCAGETVNVLGPLGNGFTINPEYKRIALIGGGVGVYPLYFLGCNLKKQGIIPDSFLGFRTKDLITFEDEFTKISTPTLTTDDGSYGRSGNALTPFYEKQLAQQYDMVYACGPKPMLNALVKLHDELATLNNSFEAELSLEERMGCGVGACLVCSCKIKSKDKGNAPNGWVHKHVCKDGPVFNINDLVDFGG